MHQKAIESISSNIINSDIKSTSSNETNCNRNLIGRLTTDARRYIYDNDFEEL